MAATAPAAARSKIVFASEVNGNIDIYVMNADGTGRKRLTTDPKEDSDPEFSPDGKKIVFTSSRRVGKSTKSGTPTPTTRTPSPVWRSTR
ncbi:MAG: TolB family protein [Sporichthyaceae bacterium]